MTARRWWSNWTFRALPVVVLVIAACGSSSAAQATGPVAFGELWPLSGDAADFGQWLLQGSQTAIVDINANGGIHGRQVNFYVGATKGATIGAVPATPE